MGLLDYSGSSSRSRHKMTSTNCEPRSRSSNAANGFGLLGPTDEQLAALRQQRGIPQAEAPSPWVSVGRGVTDLWEPVKQAYLNSADPEQAAIYRKQRAEDERLYQQGVQWATANPNYNMSRDDLWRSQVQQLPLLVGSMVARGPQTSLPATMIGLQGTQNLYDVLNALRRQFGIGE